MVTQKKEEGYKMSKNEARYKRIGKRAILRYMESHNILEAEIDFRKGTVSAYEPITNCDRSSYVMMWLEGHLSTVRLERNMKLSYWWVGYSLRDFLGRVKEYTKKHQKGYK